MNSKEILKLHKFYKNKKILITGHTGFKGRWLTLLLEVLGAKIVGISKKDENLKYLKFFTKKTTNYFLDINSSKLKNIVRLQQPEIVFHLAAQPIVNEAFLKPVINFRTNIMGTINLFESLRFSKNLKEVVIVTTDKCYEPSKLKKSYREDDKLGGNEPYSASKAAVEIITKSYSKTYYKNINISTVRAGNVLGGCDFSKNRIVPDIINSFLNNSKLSIRNPNYIRPWVYILDVILGYINLPFYNKAKKNKSSFENWNFGPNKNNTKDVKSVVKEFKKHIDFNYSFEKDINIYEDEYIFLNSKKIKKTNWQPKYNFQKMIKDTAEWYINFKNKNVSIENNKRYLNKFLREPR